MYLKQPIPHIILSLLKLNARYETTSATDFEASKPTQLESGETEVWVRGIKKSGMIGSIKLKYHRTNISVMFHGMIPTLLNSNRENVVQSINLFYGTKLPESEFDVIEVSDELISLQAKHGSYSHVGTIDIRIAPKNVVVLSDAVQEEDKRRSAEDYTRALSFLTLGTLREVSVGAISTEDASIVAKALYMETLDPWKVTKKPNPYNLYGASVTHNGAHQYDNSRGNLLLKVELNPSHNNNLVGELHLFYSIPTYNQ